MFEFYVFFFFFKQKTAYEMRISDWSSDVCSSDLPDRQRRAAIVRRLRLSEGLSDRAFLARPARPFDPRRDEPGDADDRGKGPAAPMTEDILISTDGRVGRLRSEEHTSELQSLMRISYAVFCLKKKK